MSEIGLGFYAGVPQWAKQYATAPWHLISDPPDANPLPGAKVVGRVPAPGGDGWEWDCVTRGKGAEDYANYCAPRWAKAPWVTCWTGPNEPKATTLQDAKLLSAFYVALAPLAALSNVDLAGLDASSGRPDENILDAYVPLAQAVKYLAFHEYGKRDMRSPADFGWLCFRYRRLMGALAVKGIRRPVLITELGLDDGTGWTTKTNAVGFADQLRWYALEMQKDAYVQGAIGFHVTSYSFSTFTWPPEVCQLVTHINQDVRAMTTPTQPTTPVVTQPLTFEQPAPKLLRPVYAPLTQGFGEHACDYSKYGMIGHNGLDFGAALGTPIIAAHSGRAWVYDDPGGYGKTVEIWAPDITGAAWYKTIYGHMSEQLVLDRAWVNVGQVIGKVGSTGNSTGPHLHWGLKWISGKNPGYLNWIDPTPFIIGG